MSPANDALVVVMTKAPIPGRVKTRLIPVLGPEGASALHRAMVDETLRLVGKSGLPARVVLAGDEDGEFGRYLEGDGWEVEAQAEGDLGQRLVQALRGPGRRIAIGTDCVVFEPQWLQDAARARSPVAFGPSLDGGYWLVSIEGTGGATRTEALFRDIPWSSAEVLARSKERALELGLAVELLPESYDVDDPADLDRLQADPWCPPMLRPLLQPPLQPLREPGG